MNVSASKVLLGLSVAAYTYCTWDHLYTNKKIDDAPAKASALTPALVNRVEVLSLGRDAFESVALDRSEDSAAANALAAATGVALPGKSAEPMVLQGVFMTPGGHAALVNGVTVNEGEEAELASGTKIIARKVGDTFAVIESGGRSQVLKIDDPQLARSPDAPAAAASSGSGPANPAPSSPAASSSTPSSGNPNPLGHGGGSDPYAGHRTGKH